MLCRLPLSSRRPKEESRTCFEKRRSVDHGEVRDEPVAFPQDPAALPVNGRRSPAPSPKGAATEALPPPVGSPWVSR